MRILTTTVLAMGMALPAMSQAAIHPNGASSRIESNASDALRVAKRRRKKGKKGKGSKSSKSTKPSKAASAEPVYINSSGTTERVLRQKGRKPAPVYQVTPEAPIKMDVTGPGKLTLFLYQVMPKGKRAAKATFLVSVDGGRPARVTVGNRAQRKISVEGDKSSISSAKKHQEKLKDGKHTVEITAPSSSAGAVARIEMIPSGSRTAVAVKLESKPAETTGLMAAALDALGDDEEEEEIVAAPPPPVTPAPPVEPAEAPKEVAAAPAEVKPAEAKPEEAKPVDNSLEAVTKRLASGESRDSLVGDYEMVTVIDTSGGEDADPKRVSFAKIGAEQSFTVMVQGPGEVTVRLHRLIAPETQDGADYKVIILENDVLLQQLDGAAKRMTTAKLAPAPGLAAVEAQPELSDAKEYRLKVGPKQSRFAFQVAQASEGMVARYSFAAEEVSLAAMALDFDDEEGGGDDDDDFSLAPAAAMPTVVMEVDVSERPQIVVEEKTSFIGLAVQAGSILPATGGNPGLAAGLEVSFVLPPLHRMFALGIQGSFQYNTLGVQVGDMDGVAIDADSVAMSVPVTGKVTARFSLGKVVRELFGTDLAIYTHAGGGICYVRGNTSALDAKQAATKFTWAVRGGLGTEAELGPGALALEAGYLFVPTMNLGGVLRGYSPGGVSVTLQYRLGM